MHSSGSPGDHLSFFPTRRDSAAMVVDAPMTPPTSPLPPDPNSEEQKSLHLHYPVVPSQNDPPITSQTELPQVSLDQIMRLQQLRLDQDRHRDEDGAKSIVDDDWSSAEVTKVPQRSLEDEEIHVQGSGVLKLNDFDVAETLGSVALLGFLYPDTYVRLGTGTFGRVLLVRHREASPALGSIKVFAMKVLRKSEVIRLRQVEHVNSERYILSHIRHPFIVDLYATFQDNLNIYMLLSYIPGGELFTHLRRAGRFSPDVTRFYLATIILALKYLHSYNVIYRDLKPENLLLDSRGYLRLTDFGFAKRVDDRTWTVCGTPEYLAPEIIQSDGHGKAADWWACGILCYEMLVGYPPFFDDHPYGIYEKILHGKIHWPKDTDPLSRELIRAFLHPDRSKRLGNLIGGPDDVLNHPWFRGVDWEALERREIRVRFHLYSQLRLCLILWC
jgi:Protein kinase domain